MTDDASDERAGATEDHRGEAADPPGGDDETPTVESLLRSAGVLELTPDGTDVRLTETFERALFERIAQLRGGDRAIKWLAASRGVDPGEVAVTTDGDRFVVGHEGKRIGAWHSEAGFLAAVAAEPTLTEWVDEDRLADLPDEARAELSARLVMCLERCPSCDGALSFVERESDESDPEVALQCTDCASTIATAPGSATED